MKVTFLPKNIVQDMDEGMTLLAAAALAGVDIDGNCAGAGTCGKCKVRIATGNDCRPDDHEKQKITPAEIESGYRLACRFKPNSDVTVEVPMVEGAANRKTKLVKMPEWFRGVNAYTGMACQPGRYGVAFDIGTTTVVGMLWQLTNNKIIGVSAMTNPQGVYGADVISRIMYAGESKENLNNIHNKIINCFNEIIEGFERAYGIKKTDICDITVVGNTTMSHLFMGVDPTPLAVAPFTPVFLCGIEGKAIELGINVGEDANFYLMANMAGHVGSDITAGIIATDILNTGKITLQIDVGTNGEIALTGKGKALVCSTAAGPAFEGASIFQGMRAASGAIEKVFISKDEVKIKVIDDATPVGICGSGIIDGAAQMINMGIVEASGRFAKPETLLGMGFSKGMADRLRTRENGKEFVLAYVPEGEDIVILQKDIREVQLAKAAIYAGAKILMKTLGVDENDIDDINIAGAFGNYINIESALSIGLLPKVDRSKIQSVGNAAGIGSSMALLSLEKRRQAEELAGTVNHVELSTCSDFQDEYIGAMKF